MANRGLSVASSATACDDNAPLKFIQLNIVVRPAPGQPGVFEARLDSEPDVLCVSREPLFDAARVLMALGHDPRSILRMRHFGKSEVALTARLSVAASLTIEQSAFGPVARRFRGSFKSGGRGADARN
jgi:hypothetical protein